MKKIIVAMLVLALFAGTASAGTSGTDFSQAVTLMTDWLQGSLGQLLALAMIAVGIGAGILRGNLMAFVSGIGAGLGVYVAPAIITNVVSATAPLVGA